MSINVKSIRKLLEKARPDIPQTLVQNCYCLRDFDRLVGIVDVLKSGGGVGVDVSKKTGGFTAPTATAEPQVAIFNGLDKTYGKNTVYQIRLCSIGENRVGAIKAVRLMTNVGLKEAKDLCDKVSGHYNSLYPPQTQLVGRYTGERVGELAKTLTDVGCRVSIEMD
jgi:ribosomal protein L7/L12